jgi:hypothetical protein
MKRIFFNIATCLFCIGTVFAQTPQELFADLPAVEGWTITPDFEVFNRDNLYERINGAAPLFLENNFQEMTSIEYTEGDNYITIQAYRHASPEDAFGMYASERSSDMTHYPGIGGEAQGDEYGLFFFSGCVYVKITTSNEGESTAKAMLKIAEGLAGKIDETPNYPSIFQSFPKEGLLPYTQSYVTMNYIGHEFLKPAYTIDYNLEDRYLQVFVIDGKTAEGAKGILSDYLAFAKQKEEVTEGNFLINDRYNGNIPIVWKGQYLVGAFDSNGANFPEGIYDFLNRFGGE